MCQAAGDGINARDLSIGLLGHPAASFAAHQPTPVTDQQDGRLRYGLSFAIASSHRFNLNHREGEAPTRETPRGNLGIFLDETRSYGNRRGAWLEEGLIRSAGYEGGWSRAARRWASSASSKRRKASFNTSLAQLSVT